MLESTAHVATPRLPSKPARSCRVVTVCCLLRLHACSLVLSLAWVMSLELGLTETGDYVSMRRESGSKLQQGLLSVGKVGWRACMPHEFERTAVWFRAS